MKYFLLYQIVSAGLFIFGCFGLLTNRNRWFIIVSLQIMISGILLGLIAIARIGYPNRLDLEVSIIFVMGVLVILTLIVVIFIFRVLRSHTNPEDKAT